MQEAPATAILPLDSTPEGIIDGNQSSFATSAGTGTAEVIILMSLAKSSHESPIGMGTDDSVAAEVAVGMPVAEEGIKAVAEGSVVNNQNAGARPEATSVQCSDQVPKAAVTYKQWSLESKVYTLEVLDRFNGNMSRAASLQGDMQPVTYRHILHTHLQHWSKQWSEGTLGGGKKKGGDKKSLFSRYYLGKMEEADPTAIASSAAVSPPSFPRGAGTMWRGEQGSSFLLLRSWGWTARPRTQIGLSSQTGIFSVIKHRQGGKRGGKRGKAPGSHTVAAVASQRTKAVHSLGPVRGRGHGRP
jgi:hypothetical protein